MEQLIIEQTTTEILHDVAGRITADSDLITGNGLNGKTGTAIFLYQYGKCYENTTCMQLAGSFIKEVLNNLSELTPVDYSSDLPGIEAGLKYLQKQGLIAATTAEMPEVAQQAVCESLLNFPHITSHESLHRLTRLGKYFTQNHRKVSLTGTGSFSDINRKCVLHFIRQIRQLDIKVIPQIDHKDILCLLDVLSRIYATGFWAKEVQDVIKPGIKGLQHALFDKARFKPFTPSCNPFIIAVTLLSIYYRTHNPDFVHLAMQVIDAYEGAVNKLYAAKDIWNAELLQHVLACKKLHAIVKDDSFNNHAAAFLNFYRERKSSDREQNDFSLNSGYAGEGMTLLTLEGHIQPDWLEELTGY